MKNRLIPLLLTLFVCSVFLNASPRTISNLAQQVGYITVSGHYEYRDDYGTLQPTVWGRVWVCDRNPEGDRILTDIYGTSEYFTDANGNFSSGPIVNDDGADDGLDIVVYIVTWNWAVQVIDQNAVLYHFSVHSDEWNNLTDGAHIDFTVRGVPSGQIGAWIVFSYHCGVAAGWDYLNQTESYEAPMVTCCWPYGERAMYVWPAQVIYLPDWACWWPDIILHEYGHHVMYSLYGYIPPSMDTHYIRMQSNSTTAWAEGWANFFPLVVFDDPVFVLGINATHGIPYNLEIPHWCSPNWDDGDEVEGRVAGALWDIYDSQNDNEPWYYDSFSDGFQRIWNIMESVPCNNFTEFWQAWNASGYPKQPTLLAIFQNSIDYRGQGDVDANGIVNIQDISLITAHFGNKKQNPIYPWDQRRDLNYDDEIDILDVATAAKNFGKDYDC